MKKRNRKKIATNLSFCPVPWRRQLAHVPANPRRWPRAVTGSPAVTPHSSAARPRLRGRGDLPILHRVGQSVGAPAYVLAGRVVPAGYRAAPPDRHPRRSREFDASRFAQAKQIATGCFGWSTRAAAAAGMGYSRAGTAPSGEILFLDPPNGPSTAPTRQAARSAYGAAPHNRCLEQLSSR
jgi:hypothetical protein